MSSHRQVRSPARRPPALSHTLQPFFTTLASPLGADGVIYYAHRLADLVKAILWVHGASFSDVGMVRVSADDGRG